MRSSHQERAQAGVDVALLISENASAQLMHDEKKSTGKHPEAGDIEKIEIKGAVLHFPNPRIFHSDTSKLKASKEACR